MRDLGADVDRLGQRVEEVEVLGERLPAPLHAFGQGRAGDVLDALHQTDQPVAPIRSGRRKADAAIAEDHSRDAVPEGRREQRVPGNLAVEVGVDVDEAGRDQEAVGVDFFAAEVVDFTDRGDDAVVNRDVGLPGRRAGAVDDESVADYEIVHVDSFNSMLMLERSMPDTEMRRPEDCNGHGEAVVGRDPERKKRGDPAR